MWVKEQFKKIKSYRYEIAISTGGAGSTNSTGSTQIGQVAIWVNGGNVYLNPESTVATSTNIVLSTNFMLPFKMFSTGTLGFMSTSTSPTLQYVFYE